jgi:hypothetical protein
LVVVVACDAGVSDTSGIPAPGLRVSLDTAQAEAATASTRIVIRGRLVKALSSASLSSL